MEWVYSPSLIEKLLHMYVVASSIGLDTWLLSPMVLWFFSLNIGYVILCVICSQFLSLSNFCIRFVSKTQRLQKTAVMIWSGQHQNSGTKKKLLFVMQTLHRISCIWYLYWLQKPIWWVLVYFGIELHYPLEHSTLQYVGVYSLVLNNLDLLLYIVIQYGWLALSSCV